MRDSSQFDSSLYDYELPQNLIAQTAIEPRDHSRLLVVSRSTGEIQHRRFFELGEFLAPGDVLVANNTAVLKARLLGHRVLEVSGQKKTGGKIEFLMLEEKGPQIWEGLFHSAARAAPGLKFEIPVSNGAPLQGEILRGSSESPIGAVWAHFDRDPVSAGAGEIPLPPYIERGQAPSSEDESRYQTIYASLLGSAAAPTAGLHFTAELKADLLAKGLSWEEITLHVGVGTFRPVKPGDLRTHVMHEERFEIESESASRIQVAKAEGRKIVAVGTTVVRTIESAWVNETLQAGRGRTQLFLYPGAEQKIARVDKLITNFHLPRSTLLMLVSAFAGRELVLKAYREAVQKGYRFYSYGDAMLIL